MGKRAQLVCQQLENISGAALEKYQEIIREYIRGRNGIYALYRKGRLYYVGLALSLQSRLRSHLRDRHRGAWDRFSVYLTIGDAHLREMESLLLRIGKPKGNLQSGKFYRCENLKRRFRADVRRKLQEEMEEVIDGARRRGEVEPRPRRKDSPVLAAYRDRPTRLLAKYKGKTFRARVRKRGSIRFDGRTYNSPTLAATSAAGRPINGWWFWHYERAPGDWVRLRELRHR